MYQCMKARVPGHLAVFAAGWVAVKLQPSARLQLHLLDVGGPIRPVQQLLTSMLTTC